MTTQLTKERRIVQFFSLTNQVPLALCNDGTVWEWKYAFTKDGKEEVTWRRMTHLEKPVEKIEE
jgi:hypothetical protein